MANVQLAVAGDETTQVILSVPGVQGPTGSSIPPSGTTNQVLYKQSNTDYDTGWSLVTSAMITDGTIVNGDINASAAIAGTKISPNFGSQNVLTTGTSTAASFIPSSSSVPTNGLYLPAANSVALSTSGVGRVFVDGSGRVGIGNSSMSSFTANAGDNLVVGAGASSEGITIYSGTSGQGSIAFADGTTGDEAYRGYIAYSHTLDAFQFITAATERLRITSAGLVGIGTSSPQTLLELAGNGTAIVRTSNNNPGIGQDTLIGGYEFYKADASGSGAGVVGAVRMRSADSVGSSAYMTFSTALGGTANDVERVRITGAGNVGIGTTSPAKRFEVNSGADSDVARFTNDSGVTATIGVAANIATLDLPASTGFRIRAGGSAGERLQIDSSGRLLVGTSTTSSNAGVVIQGASGGSDGILKLASDNATPADGEALGTLTFSASNHSNSARIITRRDGGTWTAGTSEPTRLEFSTTADGASSPTEQLRITSDRYVRLASGTGGIQFNGDTAAANALDDYEEGTWTPTYVPTTGSFDSITYDPIRYGKYTKIGNLVTCVFALRTDALTVGTASGIVKVGGLPFTAASTSAFDAGAMAIGYSVLFGGDVPDSGSVQDGTTECQLNYKATSNGNSVGLDVSDLGTGANNNYVTGSISYVVS